MKEQTFQGTRQREIMSLAEAMDATYLLSGKCPEFRDASRIALDIQSLSELMTSELYFSFDQDIIANKPLVVKRKKDKLIILNDCNYSRFDFAAGFSEKFLDYIKQKNGALSEKERVKLKHRAISEAIKERLNSRNDFVEVPFQNGEISLDSAIKLELVQDKDKLESLIAEKQKRYQFNSVYQSIPVYSSKEWELLAPSVNPSSYCLFALVKPDIDQSQVAIEYHGRESLELALMKYSQNTRDLGNGVLVTSKDRIPLYLKRKLELGGK